VFPCRNHLSALMVETPLFHRKSPHFQALFLLSPRSSPMNEKFAYPLLFRGCHNWLLLYPQPIQNTPFCLPLSQVFLRSKPGFSSSPFCSWRNNHLTPPPLRYLFAAFYFPYSFLEILLTPFHAINLTPSLVQSERTPPFLEAIPLSFWDPKWDTTSPPFSPRGSLRCFFFLQFVHLFFLVQRGFFFPQQAMPCHSCYSLKSSFPRSSSFVNFPFPPPN